MPNAFRKLGFDDIVGVEKKCVTISYTTYTTGSQASEHHGHINRTRSIYRSMVNTARNHRAYELFYQHASRKMSPCIVIK